MKKILIVEDELIISKMYERLLTREGNEVVGRSTNLNDSRIQFDEHQPEIILLDLTLKNGEDGFQLANELRQKGNQTPIIFTTGDSRKEIIQKLSKIEHSTFLSKPINMNELFNVISRY